MAFQRFDTETEQWVDFPEFVKFCQPIYTRNPNYFTIWVIRNTPEGEVQNTELMRVKR